MPPLSEFLGHLMSEIARARVLADVESTRIARMYADDPLLKHLSVPRFRLPDLTIDVPMLIHAIDDAEPQPQPEITNLRGVFQEIVETQLERLGAKAKKSIFSGLRKKLGDLLGGADDPAPGPVDADAWREQMIAGMLPHLPKDIDGASFANVIREAWREKLGGGTVRPKPPAARSRIEVAFTPQELQNARPENVTRFHLIVKENGIEWTSLERDGEVQQRLVPE